MVLRMVALKNIVFVIIYFLEMRSCSDNISEVVLSDLLEGYDGNISPATFKDGPITAEVQLYISSISSISDATMDYTMTFFLRQRWKDKRLEYNPISGVSSLELSTKLMDKLWVPDLYILNEKKSNFHDVTIPNKLMHIYPDGLVFYSVRVSGTFSCEMNLLKYPLDHQICHLTMESYGQSAKNLLFRWSKIPMERSESMALPQFTLTRTNAYTCDKSYSGITYTCIQLDMHLSRSYGYHLIQIFIPSGLIVCLSWVSFWLHVESTPARISLGLLTVLTMTTQSSGARANLPKVSYVKAIDVWMAVCLFFVFAALVEFAWANVLNRVHTKRKKSYINSNSVCENPKKEEPETEIKEKQKYKFICSKKYISSHERAQLVDKGSRVAFPLAFFIFNLIYWILYIYWEPVEESV